MLFSRGRPNNDSYTMRLYNRQGVASGPRLGISSMKRESNEEERSMTRMQWLAAGLLGTILAAGAARADVGDPQVKTDHPWYPGELSCSTFERLFATQAELYQRVVGVHPITDEQKVLASWLWRNTHFWHGEEGTEDLWNKGFTQGSDLRSRDYWTG